MEGSSIPPDGDRNRGPRVIAIYWTMFAVELTVVTLRVYARLKIRAFGLDDWIMAFTLLLVLGCYTAGTLIISLGGCRHVYYILADQGFNGLVDVTRLWTILQPLGVMAVAVGITSVAILILRIMGRSIWRRRFLYFSIVSTLVISITASVLLFAACKPVKGLWDPLVQASCWSPNINNDITIFTSCWNVFMDICLALLPITIFWNLHLSLKKRFVLCILMGMGNFAGISGAVKASKLTESTMSDFTWPSYDLFLWNAYGHPSPLSSIKTLANQCSSPATRAETFFIIVCGCIPTLKPVYDQLFPAKPSSTKPKASPNYQALIVGGPGNKHHQPSNDNYTLRLLESSQQISSIAGSSIAPHTDIERRSPMALEEQFKSESRSEGESRGGDDRDRYDMV
ncbi:hypothetical protein MMC14_003382 [Varicellaria rhodocarpa]|nr:hypothetical protein [Varicellaria rhodocarpa]